MTIVYRCKNTRQCYWLCRDCLKGHTHRCSPKCPDYLSIAKVKKHKAAILKDETIVEASPGQFFCWSETGKRLELWQEQPLRMVRYWRKKSVLVISETI